MSTSANSQQFNGKLPAVMALLRMLPNGAYEVLGSAVLVGKRTVLTARHLVGRVGVRAKKLRVFSQNAGILMTQSDGVRHPAFGTFPRLRDVQQDLALVQLQRCVHGIDPIPMRFAALRAGEQVTVTGFGGSREGLLERRALDVTRCARGDLPGLSCLDARLETGDSGSPVFVGAGETLESASVVGVFTDLLGQTVTRLEFDREQMIHRSWLESALAELEVEPKPPCPPPVQPFKHQAEAGSLGADDRIERTFDLGQPADRLIVAFNAAPFNPDDLGRVSIELFVDNWPRGKLHVASPFRSFNPKPRRGIWKARITAREAVRFQLNWTAYRRI